MFQHWFGDVATTISWCCRHDLDLFRINMRCCNCNFALFQLWFHDVATRILDFFFCRYEMLQPWFWCFNREFYDVATIVVVVELLRYCIFDVSLTNSKCCTIYTRYFEILEYFDLNWIKCCMHHAVGFSYVRIRLQTGIVQRHFDDYFGCCKCYYFLLQMLFSLCRGY